MDYMLPLQFWVFVVVFFFFPAWTTSIDVLLPKHKTQHNTAEQIFDVLFINSANLLATRLLRVVCLGDVSRFIYSPVDVNRIDVEDSITNIQK